MDDRARLVSTAMAVIEIRWRRALIATAAGPDISAVRPALEESAFNECVQELAARVVIQIPQSPRLIATKGESRHFPVLAADPNQHLLSQLDVCACLHGSSAVVK